MKSQNQIIAVIGTGIMGSGIATNFLKNGYKVIVWNRSKDKLEAFKKLGAEIAETPKEATSKADIVFEVTANDKSSREVWIGKDGIISGSKKGKVLIASSTLSIEWIDELADLCNKNQFTFFDMPMTGGRIGAETGHLIFLVGGNEKELNKIKDTLSAVSERIMYFGKEGSGMRFKLVLNMLQAIHLQGLGEVLNLAKEMGLDIKKAGDALMERPGGTTTALAWRDYQVEPKSTNFSIDWITKDLRYAKKSSKSNKPLLNEVLKKYQLAIKKSFGSDDWTAVNKI